MHFVSVCTQGLLNFEDDGSLTDNAALPNAYGSPHVKFSIVKKGTFIKYGDGRPRVEAVGTDTIEGFVNACGGHDTDHGGHLGTKFLRMPHTSETSGSGYPSLLIRYVNSGLELFRSGSRTHGASDVVSRDMQ